MEQNRKIDYILLEATDQYPDTLISPQTTLHGNDWYETHKELHQRGEHMLTIRQFVDFLTLLKSGKAFNQEGQRILEIELQRIFDDIFQINPERAEWLDAQFKKKLVLCMDYEHRIENGRLLSRRKTMLGRFLDIGIPSIPSKPAFLGRDMVPGIDLEYWINNPAPTGLPLYNSTKGKFHYYAPSIDAHEGVAQFYPHGINCRGDPESSNSILGVRPCRSC